MSDLITRAEAIELLGISERQLQKYGATGKLKVMYVKGSRGQESRYLRAEVEALAQEQSEIVTRAIPFPSPGSKEATKSEREEPLNIPAITPVHELPPLAAQALERLAELVSPSSLRPSELKEKPILTLREATVLTGLSYPRLRDAIRGGEIGGARIGHSWMVKTKELLSFAENLIPAPEKKTVNE